MLAPILRRQSPSAPLISIIIATRDGQAVLTRTLPTILTQEYPPEAFEIVRVDDGSLDGTAECARSLRPLCRLEVIQQAPRLLAEHAAAMSPDEIVTWSGNGIEFGGSQPDAPGPARSERVGAERRGGGKPRRSGAHRRQAGRRFAPRMIWRSRRPVRSTR